MYHGVPRHATAAFYGILWGFPLDPAGSHGVPLLPLLSHVGYRLCSLVGSAVKSTNYML